jgi:hypothetical protein
MKRLGHPLTWRTSCFIGVENNGCGAPTFAHTNGGGDFVLFDSLGEGHRALVDGGTPAGDHGCSERIPVTYKRQVLALTQK